MTNETTTRETVAKVHAFETAGLGRAPFVVIGVSEKRGPIITRLSSGVEMHVGAPGQPMGTCDYCGQGIAECWQIQSADGKRFEVGCDCVRKTGDVGLRDGMAPHKREMQHARDDARIAGGKALLSDATVRAALAAKPSPNAYRAANGETELTWADWMMRNAGRAGMMTVTRYLEKVKAHLTA